jgi:hypothetical protein
MKKNNSPIASSDANIFAQLNSNYKNDNHSHSQLDNRDASRLSPKSPVKRREIRDASRLSRKSRQLSLWEPQQNPVAEAGLFRHRPQIASTPGISPKERHRYRVVLGGEVLGERLTLDQAIALANQSTL